MAPNCLTSSALVARSEFPHERYLCEYLARTSESTSVRTCDTFSGLPLQHRVSTPLPITSSARAALTVTLPEGLRARAADAHRVVKPGSWSQHSASTCTSPSDVRPGPLGSRFIRQRTDV